MKHSKRQDYLDSLFLHALDIHDLRANGHYMPILRSLSMRKHEHAMLMLASYIRLGGRICDAGSGLWLLHRAYKRGSVVAAQNLAMEYFNRDDMTGYRHWLNKAARMNDLDSVFELGHFATRLPHGNARFIKRHRPWLKLANGDYW
jgi:hypothetical protein